MRYVIRVATGENEFGRRTNVSLLKLLACGKAEFASAGIDESGEVQESIATGELPREDIPEFEGMEVPPEVGERLMDCLLDHQDALERKRQLDIRLAAVIQPYEAPAPFAGRRASA